MIFFFFFNDTATTEIYTLSLHDALPICLGGAGADEGAAQAGDGDGRLGVEVVDVADLDGVGQVVAGQGEDVADRKSTRLNSSHLVISYAVFCLKKKKDNTTRAATL